MSVTLRRWILLCAVVGLAAASASLYIHYQLLTQPGYASPCDINATFSCSDAYRSQYGSLFGVPVALFGALWFLFVVLLVVIGSRGRSSVQESVPGYLFAFSTVGLAVILYLAYAAFFVLKELCLFCLVTYASVIGLFCLSGIATSIPMTTLPRRLFRDLRVLATSPTTLVVLILFLAGAGSAIAFFPREGLPAAVQAPANVSAGAIPANQQSDFEQYWNSLGRKTVPVSSEGAAVVIVKFTDYQCPMCGQTHFMLKPILEKYQAEMPGAVKLVSKDYPLDQSCNPAIPTIHQGACAAAAAVRLAAQQRRAAEMEDWLYANQTALTPFTVRQAAATVGHVQNWEQGLPEALAGVKSDIALAQLMQIRQTPTYFINGVPAPSNMLAQYWDLAIRIELKRAGRLK